MTLPALIVFDPALCARATSAAPAHVHADDRDQLAQVLHASPPDADVNRVLGAMGTARGVMAFAHAIAPGPAAPVHVIAAQRTQTLVFRPRRRLHLLLLVPPVWPPEQTEDALRAAWARFTLVFGPDVWRTGADDQRKTRAGQWWDRWLRELFAEDPARPYGLRQWLTGTPGPVSMDLVFQPHPASTVAGDLLRVTHAFASAAPTCHRVIAAAAAAETRTVFDSGPGEVHGPLMHHLLDILLAHTRPPRERLQPGPIAATTKRDRQRSAEPGRGWLGGLTLPRRGGGGSSNTLGTWFGFTSTSAAPSPAEPSPAAPSPAAPSPAAPSPDAHDPRPPQTQPEVVAAPDVKSLEEALAAAEQEEERDGISAEGVAQDNRQTSIDEPARTQTTPLEWTLERVWIPVRTFVGDADATDDPATGEDDHEFPEREGNEMAQYCLAYTIHETALVALVLDATMPLDSIDAILNKETTTSDDTKPVNRLQPSVRDLFTTLASQTSAPLTLDASSSGPPIPADKQVRPSSSSQWVYTSRHNQGVHMESNWDAGRILFPSPHDRAVGAGTASKAAGNNRGKSLVSVDGAGVTGRRSLMQIDHAKEMFARLVNDVWLVGKQCSSTGSISTTATTNTKRTAQDEEAYLVLTAKETSIVDAERQLGRVMKARGVQ